MNSTEEIIVYKDNNDQYNSPSLNRRALGYSYDFPEKSQKKEKKWSISSIFRRKKKEETESSSEEESQKKNFLTRRRKKPESKRKKPVKQIGTFDHVVVVPGSRNSFAYNGCNDENGVLSDPTGGFSNYIGRALPQIPISESVQKFRDSLDEINNSKLSVNSGFVDNLTIRKSRKGLTKARAVARRTSSKNASSSDEDSQRSNSSLKIRSEENLRSKETPTNKKSRAARTERYLKRRSKDGENPNNYLRLSKSDAENPSLNWKLSDDSNRSPSRSPVITISNPQKLPSYSNISLSGVSTIPPSHSSYKFKVSNSTSNPSYKPPQSMNDYNNSIKRSLDVNLDKTFFPDQRSISCDANIHKAPSAEFSEVLHVQFPIGKANRSNRNLSLIDTYQLSKARQPPPPPPRDPNRTVSSYFENGRPNSYYFDSNVKAKSFSHNPHPPLHQTKKFNSFNLHPNYRSTSDDHLPREPVQLATRPSSTTPDMSKSQRFTTRRNPEEYNYLTDKNPRSRKPICIQSDQRKTDNNTTNKALDFWKEIDRQTVKVENPVVKKTRSDSPQIFSSHAQVQTQVFLPSGVHNEPITSPKKQKEENSQPNNKEDTKRKSSNLEEALNELEAIYNSLRLGDEDLLERAEQREKESQARKVKEKHLDPYANFRGALSDSSFSYEPFDTVDSPRRRRILKKHRTADVKHDDMAFRKLNKERANTIGDPQSAVSTVSYLLSSPIHCKNFEEVEQENPHNSKEPDVTFDDVVYRNIKHCNSALKVMEPQPPFGIPLGPIAPGANSDYLHAKAVDMSVYTPIYKSKKIPDVVKDDLAFRNLRKDNNKGPALPPMSSEDVKNNNLESNLNYLKTKRAQRSLSANIGNHVKKENNNDVENEFKTLTDIADAMEIARRVLKEKENKISATKKAFMSDTDTKYFKSVGNSNLKTTSLDSAQYGLKAYSPRLGDNLITKPPRGSTPERKRSPKESTPIPISPLEDKRSPLSESTSSSLEDLLNALAEEAKETTERISNELKLLREEKEKRAKLKQSEASEIDKKLSEIDAVSEQAKLCGKLLENVVENSTSKEEDKSDHDYENIVSDKELNVDEVDVIGSVNPETCRSPFEEHKAELIASFQELKENISSIELPKKIEEAANEPLYENIEKDGGVTGEEACGVLDVALLVDECAFNIETTNPNCDILSKKSSFNLHEDSETSSGFHSNCSCSETSHYLRSSSTLLDDFASSNALDSLESLKSPKLVLATTTAGKACSSRNGEASMPTSPRLVLEASGNREARALSNRHILDDDEKPSSSWYRDPATVAIACSYGIACAHQLASIDLFAVLGIILAVISFIAALFL